MINEYHALIKRRKPAVGHELPAEAANYEPPKSSNAGKMPVKRKKNRPRKAKDPLEPIEITDSPELRLIAKPEQPEMVSS